MKDVNSPDDVLKDGLRNAAGFYGDFYIADTNEHAVSCMGYKAKTDTVIATLTNDKYDVANVTGCPLTIAAGDEVFFGMVATNIKLTSGTGVAYRSESVSPPAEPRINFIKTAVNGATIEVDMTVAMADPAALAASFVLKKNGTTAAVTSVALKGGDSTNIIITPTAAIVNGDVVTLTLATKIIKSSAGAYFLGTTDHYIENLVP